MSRGAARVAASLALAIALVAGTAAAQAFDVERGRTFVVGTPPNAAGTDRIDAARTGLSRSILPSSNLRTAWRVSVGAFTDHAPIVDAEGETYVVGTRGEVIAVNRDGTETWRASTGVNQPGPATRLADGTIVFVGDAGEAVAVRQGKVRWRSHFGRGAAGSVAPLSLDDGGVVVATTHELAALDAEGGERARTSFAEAIAAPLVSALGRVVVVTASGTVWTWILGAPEAKRAGTFGSPVDGAVALANGRTVVAVTAAQARVSALDLVRGVASTRASAAEGFWLGPAAMLGETAYLLLDTSMSEFAVAVDAAGNELARTLVASHAHPLAPDGGAALPLARPHTPALVDAMGTLAFATADGGLGVVAGAGTSHAVVERLIEACPLAPSSGIGGTPGEASVAGLAPLLPDGFVAACRSGSLIAVRGGARP